MTPQIVFCTDGRGGRYGRLADVLEHTAAKHCPTWTVQRSVVPIIGNQPSKLRHWRDVVDAEPDGTPLLLMDADMMITRPLDDVWDQAFDVAYTVRDPRWSVWPNNAGVIFCRASDAVREFLRRWIAADVPLLATTGAVRKQWLATHGSVEQAALEQALAASPDLRVLALPCVEWNCEDSSWAHFDPERTRIVHVKGALRKGIFGERVSPTRQRQIASLVTQWRAIDAVLHPEAVKPKAIGRPYVPPYAGAMRRTMRSSSPPTLYTPAWQETRKWTAASSSQCLDAALKMFGSPSSLLDLGCGDGHLVQEAIANGIDAIGVDLSCEGETGSLRHADLGQPLDLGQTFPLVLCWEVAEHLPESSADVLCDTIARHLAPNGVLLFTAAITDQGGKGHINEQPLTYWREKLTARGLLFDAGRTEPLSQSWLRVAPKTWWYGKNLQIFRAHGPADDGPTLALTMRTANRAPTTNYVGATLHRLHAQGVDLEQVHLCVTAPGAGWLEKELHGLPRPALYVPERRLSPNQNGLAQVRAGLQTGADWIGLLEDDLAFCADFLGSVRRWLRDADRADRHVFRCFGFTKPPNATVTMYDWPLEMLRGSQAVFLRRADADDFLAWGEANLQSWCRTTPWRNSTADPQIAFDKFIAAWATSRWPKVPSVISQPYLVNHVGNHSSIHRKGVRNDAPFAGESWAYRTSEATV